VPWFDAHLDLAYLAEIGRDMRAPPDRCAGPLQPAAVTLPSLREGAVTACLGTIFTEAIGPGAPREGPYTYPTGDAPAARRAGLRQLALYHAWRDAGAIELLGRRAAQPAPAGAPLRLGILMECADPIADPDDLLWWAEQGVICIGMAWARGSRYAGGNTTGAGLTDIGRQLAVRMDTLGVVHEVSHLSQRALDELLTLTSATVIASHSNCRALVAGVDERHLRDEAIREITRRGGVIGLNLYSAFLAPGLRAGGRATIEHCVAHIERICDLAGDRAHIGLGSDMDGGLAANRLPEGVNHPRDLRLLREALTARGWPEADLNSFSWGAWARFWGI
jgi:membrane dipeptidase